jgi:predicted nucleotide-binding protein (sugar kinase/HSP70/actin superfamily)
MVVGIPRALFYYKYHVLWKAFFDELGIETIVSPPTNSAILEAGLQACVGEACLPVKAYFGHVLQLRKAADAVFIPRYISVHRHEYICPKFGGLPDMIRNALPDAPPVLEAEINHHNGKRKASKTAAVEIGKKLGYAVKPSQKAFAHALEQYRRCRGLQVGKVLDDANHPSLTKDHDRPRILLLGHVYTVFDHGLNLDTVQHLRDLGADVMTAENIDGRLLRPVCGKQEEALFWTMGTQMLGAAYHAVERPDVDGVLYLTCFGCGIDAFVENMVARRMHARGKPYMALTFDEHTARAGLITRLEAFMDTLEWRQHVGTDISVSG